MEETLFGDDREEFANSERGTRVLSNAGWDCFGKWHEKDDDVFFFTGPDVAATAAIAAANFFESSCDAVYDCDGVVYDGCCDVVAPTAAANFVECSCDVVPAVPATAAANFDESSCDAVYDCDGVVYDCGGDDIDDENFMLVTKCVHSDRFDDTDITISPEIIARVQQAVENDLMAASGKQKKPKVWW